MSPPCNAPLSWLRLERYRLGELGLDERSAIAAHIAACAECAAAFARTGEDATELPPLVVQTAPVRTPRLRTAAVVSALALAAGVALAIGAWRRPSIESVDRMKGSEIGFSLVRDDDAVVVEAGGPYRDGDRFKALVTCPPGMRASFDVAVFEGGRASFPLAAADEIACGNAVPLPGAFRVTGREQLVVCLLWRTGATVDRSAVTRPELLRDAACKTLDPSP